MFSILCKHIDKGLLLYATVIIIACFTHNITHAQTINEDSIINVSDSLTYNLPIGFDSTSISSTLDSISQLNSLANESLRILDMDSLLPLNGARMQYLSAFDSLQTANFFKQKIGQYNLPDITLGASIAYLPIVDSLYLEPGIRKNYWINISPTIMQLPVNFTLASGNDITYFDNQFSNPIMFNIGFDFHQYVSNVQQDLLLKFEHQSSELINEFENITFEDSLALFEQAKDTLANFSYLSYVNKLKEERALLGDSINNCLSDDTSRMATIDSVIEAYNHYREQFNRLAVFQEKYYTLKAEYEKYQLQILETSDKLSSAGPEDLIATAENLGLSTNLPKWPLNFKRLSFGPQVINHTPMTFQNYISNGVDVRYNKADLILIGNVLIQQWPAGYNVAHVDSILTPTNPNTQKAYIAGVGFGDLDSSHILFTAAFVKEELNSGGGGGEYRNLLLSFFQTQEVLKNLNLTYEVATSQLSLTPEIADSVALLGIADKLGSYLKLSYSLPKTQTTVLVDYALVGLNYISFGNIFSQPGTYNAGIGFTQNVFNGKFSINYKYLLSQTLRENFIDYTTAYHTLSLDYKLWKWGSVNLTIVPFQYNYSLDSEPSTQISSVSNLITSNLIVNFPIKASPIVSIFSYSNYATQSSVLDTVFFLKINQISNNTIASLGGKQVLFNAMYFIPGNDYSEFNINNAELMIEVFSKTSIQMHTGVSFLDFAQYNDQLGGSLNLNLTLGKLLSWSLILDRYFEVERSKTNYFSNIFFNTAISLTLN